MSNETPQILRGADVEAPEPQTDIAERERRLGWDPTRALAIYNVHTQKLLGKVLTTIDAVIPPGPQNKAVKDTIKGQFREEHHWARLGCDVKDDNASWPDPYDPPAVRV